MSSDWLFAKLYWPTLLLGWADVVIVGASLIGIPDLMAVAALLASSANIHVGDSSDRAF